jgi:hypothetical protein
MKPHPFGRFAAVVLIVTLACALPVLAAPNAAKQACRADFSKLCSGVKLGGGRAAECLKQHESELSPDCKTAMAGTKDCGQEIKKTCGAASGAGALRECMKTHASEFSASCLATAPAQ